MSDKVIVYASKYGSAKAYAEKFAERTGISMYDFQHAPDLTEYSHIIYFGAVYFGSIKGLRNTIQKIDGVKLKQFMLISVGLPALDNSADEEDFITHIFSQSPNWMHDKITFYHLRGSLHYSSLSLFHRMLLSVKYRMIKKQSATEMTSRDTEFLERYGNQQTLVNFDTLDPIAESLRKMEENLYAGN